MLAKNGPIPGYYDSMFLGQGLEICISATIAGDSEAGVRSSDILRTGIRDTWLKIEWESGTKCGVRVHWLLRSLPASRFPGSISVNVSRTERTLTALCRYSCSSRYSIRSKGFTDKEPRVALLLPLLLTS